MPERKTISGDVDAQASGAAVEMNAPEGIPTEGSPLPVFYFREVTHTRGSLARTPEGLVRQAVQMVERVPEGGEWPQDMARFQGIGRLEANTPSGPIQRNYRFDIPAVNLEDAWKNFDDAANRGSIQAAHEFRTQYAAAMQAQASAIAVPRPAETRLVDGQGRPLSL